VVGGDTYDLLQLRGGRVGLSIADVAGKGIPAALLASSLQSAVRSAATRGLAPAELCDEVNRALSERIPTNRFVTFFYGLLDTATGVLRYSNAGHNPPLLARADGSAEWLEVGGPVLGLDGGTTWQQGELALRPGDRLVFYTDGIVEARDASDEEFGTSRLQAAVAGVPGSDAAAISRALFRAAQSFAGTCQEDDQTVVVVTREA
jgi:sigma-B regulation protein RsbU (phosphoserine phosphatase)